MRTVLILIVFSIVGVAVRLLPHPANFAPIAALALFSGVYFSKRWGWVFPLVAMLVSDSILGFYDARLMIVVYIGLLSPILISRFIQKSKNLISITAASLSGSILFFFTTNFAVWAYSSLYPHNIGGLFQSYIAGIPFFRNTILGDLFWAGVFFGGYAFALKLARHPRAQLSATPLNQKT